VHLAVYESLVSPDGISVTSLSVKHQDVVFLGPGALYLTTHYLVESESPLLLGFLLESNCAAHESNIVNDVLAI